MAAVAAVPVHGGVGPGAGGGAGGRVGGHGASAGAHGLGDDLELVGAGLVVLLLVLHATVVLEEELAGLLQHPATLADGAVGCRHTLNTGVMGVKLFT